MNTSEMTERQKLEARNAKMEQVRKIFHEGVEAQKRFDLRNLYDILEEEQAYISYLKGVEAAKYASFDPTMMLEDRKAANAYYEGWHDYMRKSGSRRKTFEIEY